MVVIRESIVVQIKRCKQYSGKKKKNSKMSETHKYFLNLTHRIDLRRSSKQIAFQNLSFYYMRKNKRQQYKINKIKIIAPTWNDEFDLPDGSYSVSDI